MIDAGEMDGLTKLRGHADWKWYGWAGHLCVARRCAYHLCTRVGGRLISTVGAFYPRHDSSEMEPIGAGGDDLFETYVFKCHGEKDGDPIIDYAEIDGERYGDSWSAEAGHYKYCWKWHMDQNKNRTETASPTVNPTVNSESPLDDGGEKT